MDIASIVGIDPAACLSASRGAGGRKGGGLAQSILNPIQKARTLAVPTPICFGTPTGTTTSSR